MDEDSIRDFLLENPDYFQKNPDLLPLLQIPHASGAAVSLVEKQVSVLRERNVNLRHRLRDLGSAAKDNDALFADVRDLVLALIPAQSVSALHDALLTVLRDDFDIEYVSLILFDEALAADSPCPVAEQESLRKSMNALLGSGRAGCGALRSEEFGTLFEGRGVVGSAAVALVESEGGALGLLAVGSSDTSRYGSGMGTLFIEFAADVLAQLLLRLSPR